VMLRWAEWGYSSSMILFFFFFFFDLSPWECSDNDVSVMWLSGLEPREDPPADLLSSRLFFLEGCGVCRFLSSVLCVKAKVSRDSVPLSRVDRWDELLPEPKARKMISIKKCTVERTSLIYASQDSQNAFPWNLSTSYQEVKAAV